MLFNALLSRVVFRRQLRLNNWVCMHLSRCAGLALCGFFFFFTDSYPGFRLAKKRLALFLRPLGLFSLAFPPTAWAVLVMHLILYLAMPSLLPRR